VDVLGFRVLRRAEGESGFTVANPALIFSAHGGSAKGSTYAFLDRQVPRPGRSSYVLEIVKLDGTSERYGHVEVTRATGQLYLPLMQAR
jgi:hypothetical protein